MKLFKKALALIMVMVMALSLAACGDNSWVYKHGDTTITSGVYLAYLMDSYSEIAASEELDPEKSLFSQILEDGTKVEDKMISITDDNIKKILYSKAGLEKLGVELNDEYFTDVDVQTEFYWGYFSDMYTNNGVGKESFMEYNRLTSLVQAYFEKIYGEGGEKEIPTQELLDYYGENYYAFKVIAATLVTEDTAEEGADIETLNAAVKARIDGYVDELNNGADYETVLAKENEASGTEVSTETLTDPTIAHHDTLHTNYNEEFATQLETLGVGEAAAVTVGNSYIALLKCELEVDAEATGFTENKTGVMSYLKSEEYGDWLTNQIGSFEVTVNNSAVKFYSPKKLVM